MTLDFLAAVLDALLPSEGELPSATSAGLNAGAYAETHRVVLAAIQSGTDDRATHPLPRHDRLTAAIRAAEAALPHEFRAFLVAVLTDYCDSKAVLAALSWPSEPPQPGGHPPVDIGAPALDLLAKVRSRGQLWRR